MALPRHRALHAGYRPTLNESRDALHGLGLLEEFLADEVVRRIARHPVTALVLLGEPGLRQRHSLTRRVRSVMADPNQVPWRPTFQRWQRAVARLRADAEGTGDNPDPGRSVVLYVLRPGERSEAVLHDRAAGKAVLALSAVDLPLLDLPTLLARKQEEVDRNGIAISVQLVGATAAPGGEWVEEHRLVPEASVMYDKHDHY